MTLKLEGGVYLLSLCYFSETKNNVPGAPCGVL